MVAKINIVHDRHSDAMSSRSIESMSSVLGSLRESKALSKMDEMEVFQKACELQDSGYGDFESCLKTLNEKNGSLSSARKALSKQIFRRQQEKA